jgi:hypothetical protein
MHLRSANIYSQVPVASHAEKELKTEKEEAKNLVVKFFASSFKLDVY